MSVYTSDGDTYADGDVILEENKTIRDHEGNDLLAGVGAGSVAFADITGDPVDNEALAQFVGQPVQQDEFTFSEIQGNPTTCQGIQDLVDSLPDTMRFNMLPTSDPVDAGALWVDPVDNSLKVSSGF